jgi:hypothetical protein
VRQQQAQAITPPLAGVHIGTEAFAAVGTNEWLFLTSIKDACDPVVEFVSEPHLCGKGV